MKEARKEKYNLDLEDDLKGENDNSDEQDSDSNPDEMDDKKD